MGTEDAIKFRNGDVVIILRRAKGTHTTKERSYNIRFDREVGRTVVGIAADGRISVRIANTFPHRALDYNPQDLEI